MTIVVTGPVGIATVVSTATTTVEVAGALTPVVAAAEVTAVGAAVGGSTVGTVAAGVLGTLSGPVGWGLLLAGAAASEVVEPIIQPTGETPFGDSFEI